jgi:threonine/homoserine/homoserine lactone efflux protein
VTQFLAALVPSAGVLFLFWLGIRAMVEADRRERSAQARITAGTERSAGHEDASDGVGEGTPGGTG